LMKFVYYDIDDNTQNCVWAQHQGLFSQSVHIDIHIDVQ